ncbi:hypothetical protein TBLA_0H02350 [Henningerozyma blattae CBS 6284]|uniref:LSM domain-containing protein n=1 Tax=Henningerozyma blattae (strain ATCC 34711 / CBS 6284 / DSM 70876 / NBRC 10599 / NRRL Y-10934 / UCD 77-7) TaxID=1071380 RepID=I2H818_HENB6|nr:hypothetical protein TBLA_0H02350 [Tetrapisispora blattae CBS 6284]CCH62520.1 hypothetical protein TBLA_0H02350 [Tetrapisispora blattae CBS 6284]
MSLLKDLLEQPVLVLTVEGDSICGSLDGFDKAGNVMVSNTHGLRVIRSSEVVFVASYDGDIKEFAHIKDTKNKIQDEYLIWEKVWSMKLQKLQLEKN